MECPPESLAGKINQLIYFAQIACPYVMDKTVTDDVVSNIWKNENMRVVYSEGNNFFSYVFICIFLIGLDLYKFLQDP